MVALCVHVHVCCRAAQCRKILMGPLPCTLLRGISSRTGYEDHTAKAIPLAKRSIGQHPICPTNGFTYLHYRFQGLTDQKLVPHSTTPEWLHGLGYWCLLNPQFWNIGYPGLCLAPFFNGKKVNQVAHMRQQRCMLLSQE